MRLLRLVQMCLLWLLRWLLSWLLCLLLCLLWLLERRRRRQQISLSASQSFSQRLACFSRATTTRSICTSLARKIAASGGGGVTDSFCRARPDLVAVSAGASGAGKPGDGVRGDVGNRAPPALLFALVNVRVDGT